MSCESSAPLWILKIGLLLIRIAVYWTPRCFMVFQLLAKTVHDMEVLGGCKMGHGGPVPCPSAAEAALSSVGRWRWDWPLHVRP